MTIFVGLHRHKCRETCTLICLHGDIKNTATIYDRKGKIPMCYYYPYHWLHIYYTKDVVFYPLWTPWIPIGVKLIYFCQTQEMTRYSRQFNTFQQFIFIFKNYVKWKWLPLTWIVVVILDILPTLKKSAALWPHITPFK